MTTVARGLRRWLASVWLPTLGVGSALASWWLATVIIGIRPLFLPSPLDIYDQLRQHPRYLAEQAWVTIYETLGGFAIAAVAGLGTAALLAASQTVERATLPLIVALNAIPKVALAPLLILWLGYGSAPKITLAASICFFPIVVAAVAGLTATPADLGELARSLSASRTQMFLKIRARWALPQVFVGLKLAMTLAVIGTVVAQLQSPTAGLGAVIAISGQSVNTPLAFAAIMLLMIISIVLFYGVAAAERLLVPWAKETVAAR